MGLINTEAVKQQIKLKRLAADDEASTMASRLKGVQERKKELDNEQKQAEKEFDLRKKFFEEENKQDLELFKNSSSMSALEEQKIVEGLDGYKELAAARRKFQSVNTEIIEQTEKEIDLTKKLNELNYSASDIDALFDTEAPTAPTVNSGGTNRVTSKGSSKKTGGTSKADQAKKEAQELLALQRQTEDQRLALIQNGFIREMALNDEIQVRKVQDLQTKASETLEAFDKAILSGNTALASTLAEQYNELQNQIEISEVTHQQKRNEILTKGVQDHITKLQEQHELEAQQRLINHNNDLAALGDNEKAKEALKKQFQKENLEREKQAVQELQQELKQILSIENFEGFNLDLISEEQKEAIVNRLSALGLKLSEINALLASMSGASSSTQASDELTALGLGGSVDILGMSPEQWGAMFTNTDTLAAGIGKITLAVGAAAEAYKMFSDFQSASENRRLQKYEINTNREKEKAQSLLDRKMISQKQYDKAVEAADKKLAKKKAEIAHKQAKREKVMAAVNVGLQTAQAIMSIWAQVPKFDFGISAGIMTGIVSALGAVQLATVLASPLPAKGYEKGFYGNMPIQREQDGKLFNAEFGGNSRSGVVDKPTFFLAGEGGKNFPEMIIDGKTLSRFNPDLKNSLYRELGRVRGFEDGYYKEDKFQVPAGESNALNSQLLLRAVNVLERMEASGFTATIAKDFDTIRRFRDRINDLEKVENKSIIK